MGLTAATGSTSRLEATLREGGDGAHQIDSGGAGTILTGSVNVRGDPDFVDLDGRDYHIGASSAAVNEGVDAGVTTDIDGDARPDWAAIQRSDLVMDQAGL